MPETNIRWASHTWNPYTWNCNKISPGCKNCYAAQRSEQYGYIHSAGRQFEGDPKLRGKNADKELLKFPPGAVVFVNSHSDTYHEGATPQMIHSIHNAAAYVRPDVTFLLLTKRPERALALAPHLAFPTNLWVGASIENEDYLRRLDDLLQIPAAGHFVSIEPQLSPLPGLKRYLKPNAKALGWVIQGAESGAKRRPFDKAWAREVRDMCVEAETPYMFKQGSAFKSEQDRLLDGRTWDETPFDLVKMPGATGQMELPL